MADLDREQRALRGLHQAVEAWHRAARAACVGQDALHASMLRQASWSLDRVARLLREAADARVGGDS